MGSIEMIDSHCHIHEASKPNKNNATGKLWLKAKDLDPDAIINRAVDVGVTRMICIGTTLEDSQQAVEFVATRPQCWASIGLHPHEAKDYVGNKQALAEFAALAGKPKVVAVGECGLDYFYNHSSKKDQEEILRFQIELALKHNLPMSFHVREAFDDFWPIFDSYKNVRGVIHSFTAGQDVLNQILKRGLYVGLNGIVTFTKNERQLAAAKALPLSNLLLETDAPFLTPEPFRGTICEPRHTRTTAEFLAKLRGETLREIALAASDNATTLFRL
ncbi:MAG TPA: TatD family hydrolase [Patescibacteria group bacterium]|nr:TatD family hydrolase [Patescibacteria group bacterium]